MKLKTFIQSLNRYFNLKIFNQNLPRAESTKFLGVTFDERLNFHEGFEKLNAFRDSIF
jgi:uncharacterized HAD superfamily protein